MTSLPENPITLATKTLNCTQVELASRLGCSTGLISMWKTRGYITQRYLAKACEVTGLPPYALNPFVPRQISRKSKALQ